MIVLLKKQVQGIQVEAWRSQASGLLEANLSPGPILGLREEPKLCSLWSLCQEECQPQRGRTAQASDSEPSHDPRWSSVL